MNFEIRKPYILIATSILIFGLIIVFLFSHIFFLRHFLSDVIIVIFMYSFIKVIFPYFHSIKTAIGVFVFSITVEFLQYLKINSYLRLNPKDLWVRLTLGSTFDPMDLVAYTIGLGAILFIEKKNYVKNDK